MVDTEEQKQRAVEKARKAQLKAAKREAEAKLKEREEEKRQQRYEAEDAELEQVAQQYEQDLLAVGESEMAARVKAEHKRNAMKKEVAERRVVEAAERAKAAKERAWNSRFKGLERRHKNKERSELAATISHAGQRIQALGMNSVELSATVDILEASAKAASEMSDNKLQAQALQLLGYCLLQQVSSRSPGSQGATPNEKRGEMLLSQALELFIKMVSW
jgi:hypothetical protein